MKKNNNLKQIICALLASVMLFNLTGCNLGVEKKIECTVEDPTPTQKPDSETAPGSELTEPGTDPDTTKPAEDPNKNPNPIDDMPALPVSDVDGDFSFSDFQMNLAVNLFKAVANESENENTLISPLSIQLALAMTANGADTDTREEMEQLLGNGLNMEKLNEYLYSYVNSLPSEEKSKLEIANSIWFRDNESMFTVNEDFLQKNTDYYSAEIFKSAFDDQTVTEINNWVADNTDNMIDKIVDKIDPDTMMYLINAIIFDSEWNVAYKESAIRDDIFHTIYGEERTVSMMTSTETRYLSDDMATGFIKDYKDGNYSFVALLPNEDVSVYDYIEELTGEKLTQNIQNVQYTDVIATIPKFSYEYSLNMNDILADLGIPTAFDPSLADFSGIGTSIEGNLYIGNVLHKTFIEVSETGTKAAAVTSVEINCESVAEPEPPKVVKLDRPFVYIIMDNENQLPIFIGVVTDVQE